MQILQELFRHMHATFVTLWLQVVQPLANVHETKWTPHVKRETDVAQSYTSSAQTQEEGPLSYRRKRLHTAINAIMCVAKGGFCI